jgi:hypothetical protein
MACYLASQKGIYRRENYLLAVGKQNLSTIYIGMDMGCALFVLAC